MKRPKKCPHCGSTRTSINEEGSFYCRKCGFINAQKKACFIDFQNYSD